MLAKQLGAGADALKYLRAKGASSKKVILSTIFSLRSGRAADEFYHTVKSGKITWGDHLNVSGRQAKDMIVRNKKNA